MIKKILLGIAAFLLFTILLGFGISIFFHRLIPSVFGMYAGPLVDYSLMFLPNTYIYGAAATALIALLILIFSRPTAKKAKKVMKSKVENFESNLENSRFITEKERDFNFSPYKFTKLRDSSKDGVPVYAEYNKKRKELDVNLASPMHGLIIGATGSGKTTTFINPMIQLIAAAEKGSSMIMTDPKGELLDLHSAFLVEKGYDVKVLDLRDTYSSSRWNPLGGIWDSYQEYLKAGEGIVAHRDSFDNYSELQLMDEKIPEDGEIEYISAVTRISFDQE